MVQKIIIVCIIAFISGSKCLISEAKNFEIKIDGKSYEVAINDKINIENPDGSNSVLELARKTISTYSDNFISFLHNSDMNVNSTNLGFGIKQIGFVSATGSALMIQEYSSANPIFMLDMMLNEITKEQVNYGYSMRTEIISKHLESGKLLSGKRAILKYKEDTLIFEVYVYGKRDVGIIIITTSNNIFPESDQSNYNLFFDSLSMKF